MPRQVDRTFVLPHLHSENVIEVDMEDRTKGYKMLLPPRYDLPATAGAALTCTRLGFPTVNHGLGRGLRRIWWIWGKEKPLSLFRVNQAPVENSKAVVTQMALVKINGSENEKP